jgi:hypothetical protein
MVAAELGRKRIKAVILSVHLHIRNVIYQRVIAISEPCIDVQTINMLSQGVNIKDVSTIEVVERRTFDENVFNALVLRAKLHKQFVQRMLLIGIAWKLIPIVDKPFSIFYRWSIAFW